MVCYMIYIHYLFYCVWIWNAIDVNWLYLFSIFGIISLVLVRLMSFSFVLWFFLFVLLAIWFLFFLLFFLNCSFFCCPKYCCCICLSFVWIKIYYNYNCYNKICSCGKIRCLICCFTSNNFDNHKTYNTNYSNYNNWNIN